jgi:cytochrome c-type biogenesis protein CcmH/NrfF
VIWAWPLVAFLLGVGFLIVRDRRNERKHVERMAELATEIDRIHGRKDT